VGLPALANVLGLLSLASLGGTLVVESLLRQLGGSGNLAEGAAGITFAVVFTAVGVVVARQQPRNVMGWLLIAVALSVQLSSVGAGYARLDYSVHRGRLPLGALAVLLSPGWDFAFMLVPLIVVLFPAGELGSRWRWPLRAYLALGVVFAAGVLSVAVAALDLRQPVDGTGNLVGLNDPIGANAWFGPVQVLGYAAAVVLVAAGIALQLRTYRRSGGERRQQIKWLAAGAAVLVLCFVINGATGSGSGVVGSVTFSVGLSALPVGIGVGVLRYRLYEIDRLISRTLSYAILTGLLVGVFIGLVALSTNALALSGRVGVAASTLAAAAMFNPLRVRIQRLVDRRFNRAHYDAEATVAAFTARLRDAVEIDAIRADLLDAVTRAVEPTHASVWIKP